MIVYDSATDEANTTAPTIKEVLSHKETVLRHVLNDNYLYLEMKIVITVEGGVGVLPSTSSVLA